MPDDETLIALGAKYLSKQEQARERSRLWRSDERNKAKIRAYKKDYNERMKATIRAYQKQYHATYH